MCFLRIGFGVSMISLEIQDAFVLRSVFAIAVSTPVSSYLQYISQDHSVQSS